MVDKLERAVANLGRYYGAISRDAFVSLLANKDRSLPVGLVAPDLTSVSKVGRAILDVTEGGFTTPQLITYVNTLAQGASPKEKSEIFKAVKICYEPMGSDDSNAKIILSSETPVVINGRNRQGVIRRGDQSGPFSIRRVMGVPESSNINSTPGAPGPDETTFSVIQVFSPRITVSNRDMGALTLFLNAIPTIEMSRAVPFIDIVLLQKSDPIAKDDTGTNRVRSLSLGQFLLGNKPVSLGNAEGSYTSAIDSEIQTLQQRFPEFVNSSTGQSDGLSTAGMELFTSPQTLVPANEFHKEGDEIAGSDQASRDARALRGSPIIDRFRPLMTLKSLSINIAPTSGLMSYKSGKLSLTLHDRSRLTDVASFVTPGKYQNVHMQIEYGWAHPDSRPQESPSAADPTNLFADLIGSLRVKEKYAVINPSLSFGDSGQVDIEIPLAMLGHRAAQQVHIALDPSTKSAIDEVKRLTDLIEVIRNRLDSTTITSLFGSGDVIGSLSSANGILGMSDEVKKSLRRVQIAANQSGSRSASLRELGSALGSLIGPPSPTAAGISPGSAAGILGASIKNVIQNKMRLLRETSDPFICPIENLLTESQVRAGSPKYVSLGKIISVFVGSSVSSSDYYKDFQVIFYNFNEKASFMQNINIASMPVDIDDFQKILEEELDKLVNMPISMFMDFLSTYFISDSGAFAYGFSSLYERRSGEQNTERQVAQAYRDNPPGLFAKEQEILLRAYGRLFGDSGGDLEFKMPTVQMYLETVPIKTTDGRLTSDTILRAHIFDSQSSTHVTPQRLLQAANSDKIGLINASAHELMTNSNQVTSDGEPSTSSTQSIRSNAEIAFWTSIQDAVSAGLLEAYPPVSTSGGTPKHRIKGGLPALKRFLMSTMPSVRYGEGNSGIKSAKLASIQDSALSTIQILRRGKNSESPVGDRERGIPLQILPVECTLETIGCPLWSFAQQLFIDFGTGTTADAIYGVVGVEHTLSAGEFKSSVKLTPISSYASYFSLFNNIDQAISVMEAQDPEAFRAADTTITSARRAAAEAARTRRQRRILSSSMRLTEARVNAENSDPMWWQRRSNPFVTGSDSGSLSDQLADRIERETEQRRALSDQYLDFFEEGVTQGVAPENAEEARNAANNATDTRSLLARERVFGGT